MSNLTTRTLEANHGDEADGAVSYGGVIEVMDAATGAGAERIGIMDRSP